jgi:hypothetical protein
MPTVARRTRASGNVYPTRPVICTTNGKDVAAITGSRGDVATGRANRVSGEGARDNSGSLAGAKTDHCVDAPIDDTLMGGVDWPCTTNKYEHDVPDTQVNGPKYMPRPSDTNGDATIGKNLLESDLRNTKAQADVEFKLTVMNCDVCCTVTEKVHTPTSLACSKSRDKVKRNDVSHTSGDDIGTGFREPPTDEARESTAQVWPRHHKPISSQHRIANPK